MKGRRASNQAIGAKTRGNPWASALNCHGLVDLYGFIASLQILTVNVLLNFDEWSPAWLQCISTSGNKDQLNGDGCFGATGKEPSCTEGSAGPCGYAIG